MNSDAQAGSPQNDDGFQNDGSVMRRTVRTVASLSVLTLALLAGWSTMVFVDESEYVIVERFGEIVAVHDRPEDRGLQFKLPWPVDVVRRFDRRVRLYSPPGREVFTSDKKNLTVTAFVCWKIADPPEGNAGDPGSRPVVRFFRNLAAPDVAEARLDSRVRSLLNTEFGRLELTDLLSVGDSHAAPDAGERGLLSKIARDVRARLEQANDDRPALTEELGIEIVDLRIRRINFPTGNRQAVYDRMRSERRKEADYYRAEGVAANKSIQSRADLQYQRVISQAEADAERLRGAARAESIAIRNAAQALDPEFYIAQRTLQTYRQILNERTTLVLSASSNLLKMLTDGVPEAGGPDRKPEVRDQKSKDGEQNSEGRP